MYKSMSLLVLVALAACVVSMEIQDQEAAEQYYRVHGFYPTWYTPVATAVTGVRTYPYPTYGSFPFTYAGYNTYPAAFTGVKNVATPYTAAAYPYPYGYAYNTYPYAAYGAVPYVAAAPAANPVKA
ncbi:hypothetical protein GHT06_012493 [Daphnia sinensis]|uniref:Uncharacterized protein n=1 Tax=Daphnia sinensis TaxID=1820382 RepID=A0AAD5KXP0_9CRUS|nr:hypothetical protein GHT06_012493 [Daphnia sinensis]